MTAATNTDTCDFEEHWGLGWDVRRSVRYHSARQAFFEKISRIVTALNILLSTSAASALIATSFSNLSSYIMFLVALINVIDLVVGTSHAAWLHRDLKNKFIELEKLFFLNAEITKAELEDAKRARLSIEMLEPPVFRTLDLVCHNELVNATRWESEEEKSEHIVHIPKLKYFLRNLYRH